MLNANSCPIWLHGGAQVPNIALWEHEGRVNNLWRQALLVHSFGDLNDYKRDKSNRGSEQGITLSKSDLLDDAYENYYVQ